jgi:hypothetical protein
LLLSNQSTIGAAACPTHTLLTHEVMSSIAVGGWCPCGRSIDTRRNALRALCCAATGCANLLTGEQQVHANNGKHGRQDQAHSHGTCRGHNIGTFHATRVPEYVRTTINVFAMNLASICTWPQMASRGCRGTSDRTGRLALHQRPLQKDWPALRARNLFPASFVRLVRTVPKNIAQKY